jgi:uncharacterized protein YqhQ
VQESGKFSVLIGKNSQVFNKRELHDEFLHVKFLCWHIFPISDTSIQRVHKLHGAEPFLRS